MVQNYKAQLRSSERELKAANKKVIYRDEKLKKVASDVASSRLKKELECANSKLLDQNEVIADLTTEVKTLKKKNQDNTKKYKQDIKSKDKEISALKIQVKGAGKTEKENENLKKRLARVDESKLQTQRDIAAKRLKNTELILEQRRLDRELKEQEKKNKEHLMVKRTELRTKEKAMDQLMKEKAKAKQLEDHHKRIHSFSQKFCGAGRPDFRTGRFPPISSPFAGMNADNPFLAEAIAEAAKKSAQSAKRDAELKQKNYMKDFQDIMSMDMENEEPEETQTQTFTNDPGFVSDVARSETLEKGQMTLTQTAFVRPLSKAGPGYVTPTKKQDHIIQNQEPILRRNGKWVEMYDPISDKSYFHNEQTNEFRLTIVSDGLPNHQSDSELSDKKMSPEEKKNLYNSRFESCDGSGKESE